MDKNDTLAYQWDIVFINLLRLGLPPTGFYFNSVGDCAVDDRDQVTALDTEPL